MPVLIAAGVLGWRAIWVDPVIEDTTEQLPTPEELATVERIEEHALAFIARDSEFDKLYKRDAHTYAHGCVEAHFTVLPNLEPRLQHGVLARPGHVYPAWVRFSNGTQSDDQKPDGRGMAIKLMDVPGDKLLEHERTEPTQDFVMVNYPTFLLRDVAEYLAFFEKQAAGKQFGYFIGWNPFAWHLREFRIGLDMLMQKVPSPLVAAYYSMLPFKLGPELNIKYSALSCNLSVSERCEPASGEMPESLSEHYLREALVEQLTPRAGAGGLDDLAARFSFRVQLQKPDANMPIEDAAIDWSQKDSPYIPVAELSIRMQRFNSDEQNRFCEELSFSPWHALPAHRPIGGLNRARRVVYDAISASRHRHNDVPRHEPRGFCLRLDGEPCATRFAKGTTP